MMLATSQDIRLLGSLCGARGPQNTSPGAEASKGHGYNEAAAGSADKAIGAKRNQCVNI